MWAQIVKKEEMEELSVAEEEPETCIATDSDTESISDNEVVLSKKTIIDVMNAIKKDGKLIETFGWENDDLSVFAQNAIKRFRLKKLKSLNEKAYYLDNVYYFIWEYSKEISNAEHLLKPSDEICKKLRVLNEIMGEPYLVQPEEFW
jgi:hypothetical protein